MVGITINGKHSHSDLGLILSSKVIETPEVKKMTVDIAGGDGQLDFTDAFGEAKFNNRKLTFTFSKHYINRTKFIEDWSNLQNEFHGKKVEIILDEEPEFYYVGRLSILYTLEKNVAIYSFEIDAEPYKLKTTDTIVTMTGSGNVHLYNLRKKVVPTITTTASTKIMFGSYIYNVSSGEYVIPELELVSGENVVSVEGTGTTTFKYKEGGL